MTPTWIDSHCHLQDTASLDDALARADAGGVAGFVCIGTTEQSSREGLEIARSRAGGAAIWATVGIHPHTATEGTLGLRQLLSTEARAEGPHSPGHIVAVGECGLDYHYDYSPREVQRETFVEQIGLAKAHDLTLVIHTREAWDDTFAILQREGAPERTIIHCFTGGPDEARGCLELGAYLSFSGIITFKNAQDVREAASICPLDRLLVETDAPYLAPVPHRGQPNEPAFVSIVGAAVAEQRSVDVETLARVTSENTVRAFALER
jgi:TatD DNase family protein